MDWHDKAAGVESIVTATAVLVGGIWALVTFALRRERYPKARVHHRFTVIDVDEKCRVLRVDVFVENVGQKLLHLRSMFSRLHQVLPVVDAVKAGFVIRPDPTYHEIFWPEIKRYDHFFGEGEREVEPGENENFQFDYLISPDVEIVQAYTYVTNPAKWFPFRRTEDGKPSEIGWGATDIFDLRNLRQLPSPPAPGKNS